MLDLPFVPDREAGDALYVQLADHLRDLITTSRLRAGEKLPATRELAAALGIGRNTAAKAYQRLVDDGALLAHVGQGTFVSSRVAAQSPLRSDASDPRAFTWSSLYSRVARQRLPRGFLPERRSEIRFDFRCGRVDPTTLPVAELRRAYARAISKDLAQIANRAHPFGYPPLRDQIARLLLARGIACSADDVLVTIGAQQALDLVARVLIDPGDRVAVENPGYPLAAMAFHNAGAEVLGIDVDSEGLRTDQLARTLRSHRLKAIYVTPAAQLPTGALMSDARRRALLELADETQTPIVEDDYDSEFRHGESAPPALKTWDRAGQVVYVGTFSKSVFPGLRLGYVVAPPSLRERLAVAQLQSTFGASGLDQAAMSELLESGAFERHVRRLRRHYSRRRASLLDALAKSMPDGTQVLEPRGGLQVFVTLPARVSGTALQQAARARGIVYESGRSFFLDERGADSLVLSFANQTPESIAEGIRELAGLVGSQSSAGRRRARRRGEPSK